MPGSGQFYLHRRMVLCLQQLTELILFGCDVQIGGASLMLACEESAGIIQGRPSYKSFCMLE